MGGRGRRRWLAPPPGRGPGPEAGAGGREPGLGGREPRVRVFFCKPFPVARQLPRGRQLPRALGSATCPAGGYVRLPLTSPCALEGPSPTGSARRQVYSDLSAYQSADAKTYADKLLAGCKSRKSTNKRFAKDPDFNEYKVLKESIEGTGWGK